MKNNPRITKKERGLLKGAIRRVFSRSDLRKMALEAARVPNYFDPTRPRVKKWSRCNHCDKPTPEYLADVDHVIPIVPVDLSFDEMSFDDAVNRAWCELKSLQVLCEVCHTIKTKAENQQRRLFKKQKGLK